MKTKTKHMPGIWCRQGPWGQWCFKCKYLLDAAPDLLESAKIISDWVERVADEVTMGPDDNKALNNLRAAIATAERDK